MPAAKMKKGQRLDLGADRVTVTTWQGREGESHEFFLESNRLGHRIVVHFWHDDDSGSVRRIKGDAWRKPAEFVTYDTQDVEPGSDEGGIRFLVDAMHPEA